MSILSKGIIDRAFDAGTYNPAVYLRRYPAAMRPKQGGYEIQCTPQEIASLISQVRSYLTGKRMLCLGTETLGAERFIAENCGMEEMDILNPSYSAIFIGGVHALNSKGLEQNDIKSKQVHIPSGVYDLITIFGKPSMNIDQIMEFAKIGTHVVCLGTSALSKNPEMRSLWMGMRKKYMTMLQTGARDYETGVGIVKVLYVKNSPTPSLASPVVIEDDMQWNEEEKEILHRQHELKEAPYGRKKDGTPKSRPGRPVVA